MPGFHNELQTPLSDGSAMGLARGLGWFSIALGLGEVLAPAAVAGWLGLRGQERLVRIYGVREIANGIGILQSKDPAPWVWGRVAGDALDLATVAPHLRNDHPKKDNVAYALAALAGVTLVDVFCAFSLGARRNG